MNTKQSKLTSMFATAASVLAILAGLVLAFIPIRFRDYLVAYQFRPLSRPFYPLFYGAIFGGGIAIVVLGAAALFLAIKKKQSQKKPGAGSLIFAFINLTLGTGLVIAIIALLRTALYISADDMYWLFITGLIMILLLFGALAISGAATIAAAFKKSPVCRACHALFAVPLVLTIVGLTVFGVIMLPADAERLPYPDPENLTFTTLYAQGDSGYDTFKIPTAIVAPDGTILAFSEARTDSKEDWSKTDVVVRRSADQGKTWSPLEVLFEDGNNVIGNACPVVDETTGFIWMLFCKNNDTAFKTHSKDNGLTWAEPEEITGSVKLPGWTWYATGPSHGIQLKNGTLMIPADHVERRKMCAHVVFSKDGGATWELGDTVPGGEEATMAQLDDGSLYINVRPVKASSRVTSRSYDMGVTFTDWAKDPALPDPMCQGSLIKVERPEGSVYLFTNPADRLHREKMTVRLSEDGCRTWTASKVLYDGMASYSALTLIDPKTELVGAFFETGANFYAEEIVFTSFPVSYLTDNA